jgi:hypothetical protein
MSLPIILIIKEGSRPRETLLIGFSFVERMTIQDEIFVFLKPPLNIPMAIKMDRFRGPLQTG